MLRILLADDHEFVRKGLLILLQEEFPSATIAEANETQSLITQALSQDWDIVISDLSMPGGGGFKALQAILLEKPDQPMLIMSIHFEEQYALKAIQSGARGFMNKADSPDEFIGAVKTILSGKSYIPSILKKKTGATHEADGR